MALPDMADCDTSLCSFQFVYTIHLDKALAATNARFALP